ncbi:hypothetical protein VW41_20700 [Klebsiella michiganensis]|nr:hypothetical protein VW41_20700 [Klebsiella michiganensis]
MIFKSPSLLKTPDINVNTEISNSEATKFIFSYLLQTIIRKSSMKMSLGTSKNQVNIRTKLVSRKKTNITDKPTKNIQTCLLRQRLD